MKQDKSTQPTQATLAIDGKKIAELPIYTGTHGDQVIAVDSLAKQGFFTYDPGFVATAACESKITYIDGEQGKLLYRGYPIESLAEQCDYMQVCHLLLEGELPDQAAYENFVASIQKYTVIDDHLAALFQGFTPDVHPMGMMVALMGAASAFSHDGLDISNPEHQETAAMRSIASMPMLAAMSYRHTQGLPFVAPGHDMSYAENFLHMMFDEGKAPNPIFVNAMDKIFTLHADHEQNASTSTVRMAGSTGANPFACVAAGIAALWGAAHGGANEACLNMLKQIGSKANIAQYIQKARDPDDAFRLMGFGHRVYKSHDPRGTIMRDICHQVLAETGKQDHALFDVAIELERIALEDEYFISRKLYPNVDFYSGITLSALGIPTNMFTVIFALARTVGWVSHWKEMINNPHHRISRPRQLYTGEGVREV